MDELRLPLTPNLTRDKQQDGHPPVETSVDQTDKSLTLRFDLIDTVIWFGASWQLALGLGVRGAEVGRC